MTLRTVFAIAALAGLAACDRPSEPAPAPTAPPPVQALPFERAEPITWDETLGAFAFEGKPLTAARLWRFEDGPQGFTGQGAAVSFSPMAGVHVTNEVFDALLRSPDGLALDGARFNLVLVRLGRESQGSPWDGSLYWTTDTHGEIDAFHAKPFLGGAPALNETVILAYDMARPIKGGDDWQKSMIRQIRVDTDDGAGGRFVLRQIAVVENPAPDRLRAPDPAPKTAPAAAPSPAPAKDAGLR